MNAQAQSRGRARTALIVVCLLTAGAVALGAQSAGERAARMQDRLPRPEPVERASRVGLPETGAMPVTPEDGWVNFSFDQVDVVSFVRLVGEQTGMRFVVDSDVAGKITVISPRVRRADVYALFVSILESVGCSIVREGELHRVVKLGARAAPMGTIVTQGDAALGGGVFTKVFLIEHVSASELAKMLEPRITGGKVGGVSAIDETNHLVITDTAAAIRRVELLVGEIDQPGLARITDVVPLRHADAETLAGELGEALLDQASPSRGAQLARRLQRQQGLRATAASGGRRAAVIVPSAHANSLVLVGTPNQVEEFRHMIARMDVEAPSGRGRFNAIFLNYLAAEEAAESINKLLDRGSAQAKGAAALVKQIAIESSKANNALLVDASPADFEVVSQLVAQLDRMPAQVHIRVMIAEITVSDEFQYGVEFAALDMPEGRGQTVVQGASRMGATDSILNAVQTGIFPNGISVGLAYGSRIDDSGNVVVSYPGLINIDAIRRDGRFKVLSETALEALDNREASVQIVNEIPILTSTIQGGSGTARDVIQNIERIDVGIKLKLTPHIIEGERVRMELNPSIEAMIDSSGGDNLTPTIAKREVNTTVTVGDGQTIVIAGLTREDESVVRQKVPILGHIPIVGMLFRRDSTSRQRTNLLIFVTPMIVDNAGKAHAVRQEWELKTGLPEGRE